MEAAARELAGISPRFHALKARLDPAGVLNPGRLFPVVHVPEPAAPPLGIDPVSQIATLDAQQPAADRDEWLANEGWELRFPTSLPLAAAVAALRQPWETRVLGASAMLEGRRAVLVAVPRSSAGPDPREALPADTYETLTVPVVRRAEAGVRVSVAAARCFASDIRPSRDLGGSVEFRGPAASDLAQLAAKLAPT